MQNLSKKILFGLAGLLIVIIGVDAWLFFGFKKSTPDQNIPIKEQINPTPSPTPKPTITPTASSKPPQFVVMAFDGSYSLDMWNKTLDFSEQMKASGTPVHFTYFLSGVYFLNYRKNQVYHPPQKKPGDSLIGFGLSNTDVEKRVAYVNRAVSDGHELGSHANGHYDGSKWSEKDWQQEFDEFNKLIFSIAQNNDVSEIDAPKYKINIEPSQLTGFRAPELAKNPAMFTALKNSGFKYDTSKVGKPDQWPTRLENGLWEFPLATIKYASTTSNILSMDYNFYFKQSGAKDIARQGDQQWNKFYNDTYSSYINYFNTNYNGNRAPVFIGSHFSEWNDGVYWASMRDFAQNACGQPEVKCVTFSELEQYLEANQNQ